MPRWAYNPHTAGKSIRPSIRARTERRILDYAAKHYSGKFTRIDVRFHGALCYDCSATGAGSVGPAPRRLARIYADTTHLINARDTANEPVAAQVPSGA